MFNEVLNPKESTSRLLEDTDSSVKIQFNGEPMSILLDEEDTVTDFSGGVSFEECVDLLVLRLTLQYILAHEVSQLVPSASFRVYKTLPMDLPLPPVLPDDLWRLFRCRDWLLRIERGVLFL